MSDFPIAVIGAGFAGIGAAIRLKQAGLDSFVVFERAAEIGGTWRDNTYPGAACDVRSHVYSLSFEPSAAWSRRYAGSAEIQSYLLGLVEKWRLRRHLRLETAVVGARFDEAAGSWTLETSTGETHVARVVLACLGGLTEPAFPDLEGLDGFTGPAFHTARWRHDVDLRGRRVAVIGTGASAVQVIPRIAPEVARLHVFQRTPSWVVPRRDAVYPPRSRRRLARRPILLRARRWLEYSLSELLGPIVFLDSRPLSAVGAAIARRHLRAQVSDPRLRRELTPRYQFGCKRVLVSDDYYPAFERPNVELVTAPIAAVRPTGVETAGGELREVDVIVLATGFAVSLASAPFPITGRGGRRLADAWAGGAAAYKGLAISGFPNWFVMMGPNTGPGHTSVLVYTEAQIAHALRAIAEIRRRGLRFMDVRREVQDRYNEGLQHRMKRMSWSSGCHSWYLSADGVNRALYPGFATEYVLRTRRLDPSDYELVAF